MGILKAECVYPIDSSVTGFQLIAQKISSSNVHKLLTNQTRNRQTLVTLQTEEAGTYEVVIFAVRKGSGILDSGVQFSDVMTVEEIVEDSKDTSYSVIRKEWWEHATIIALLYFKQLSYCGAYFFPPQKL